ncbi:hypothetical protein CJJ18_04380 [Candidatus Williamhamiltonella defendens]|uniref:Uncharacterized protein n=1 Tax=Candidatus Williamhamiltonella defendens TaxID=138072 RepID=A0AAC9VLP7_9ENTR|nr:hypothetical protein CJJ18_04380 [Candidatus Hamiltonella defensa]AWK16354.1 hypothetical protein CCS40_04230 [Candidatus Hamiltonella defensa]
MVNEALIKAYAVKPKAVFQKTGDKNGDRLCQHRAVDYSGQTIDFLPSNRDKAAALRFFRQAFFEARVI